jgi:hypothetical protein
MSHVIPSCSRTLREIFKEKVPGTDRQLISPELIAYLKWLIYVAAYEDRSTLAHVEFYQKQVALFQNPATYKIWRSLLYKELDEWYKEHPPTKKRKSYGAASGSPSVVADYQIRNVDNFVDLLDDDVDVAGAPAGRASAPPAAGVALAAAASAAAQAAAASAAAGGPA